MDVFETIAKATRPENQKFICKLYFVAHKAAGIAVTLFTTTDEFTEAIDCNEAIIILHYQLENWLQDNGYLNYCIDYPDETGKHVQKTGVILYSEFLETDLTEAIIYEYLRAKNLTTLQYDPD